MAKNVKGLPEGVKVTVKETPLTTPGTETAGEKDSVTVTVEYKDKDGNIIATKEVKVPVTVTPKVTPIVVEVGTPITKDDVKKHIELPNEKGWEIVEENWTIPTTETAGQKPSVKVKVKLPSGKEITVEVPVTVTPKRDSELQPQPSPATPAVKVVTRFVDENGKDITSPEEGLKDPKALEGYVFDKTTTDKNGTVFHHYKKATAPTPQPVEPATPGQAEQPATPAQPATPKYVDGQKELPNTGTEANASLAALGLLGALGGFGLLARKKKED